MMNHVEHYHDWLRDAHAMEKQAESMLESMASRIDNYPDVRARIEQHINETKRQITLLEEILDRNDISRSVLKDSMSKMAALGQSIGGMFPSDEIVKGSISGYVFEQFEIACYTSLLAAAKKAGDTASVPAIETILAEEREMAEWLIRHIPQTTEQFLLRSDASGVEAKNNQGESPCSDTSNSCNIRFALPNRTQASPTFYWNSSVGLRANWLPPAGTLRKD